MSLCYSSIGHIDDCIQKLYPHIKVGYPAKFTLPRKTFKCMLLLGGNYSHLWKNTVMRRHQFYNSWEASSMISSPSLMQGKEWLNPTQILGIM